MNSIGSVLVSQQITTLTFNGQSKYSASYQQILQKAVQNSTIKLSGLDDSLNVNQGRLTALQNLDSAFTSLQGAITTLSTAVGSSSLSASAANPALASFTLGAGANAGSYQLEVDDLGAATQAISTSSNTTVTDPNSQNIDTAASFSLSVTDPDSNGGATKTSTINNPSGTLSGLVNTINTTAGLGVTASIVNVGNQSSPDYRLSLQSKSLGAVSVSMTGSSSTDLLTMTSTGHNSIYKVAGTTINGTSDTVELAPGLTATLLQASPGSPTTVRVSNSTGRAQAALQLLTSAYNAVVDQLNAQRGTNAGILSGDSLVTLAQQTLSKINQYTNNGSGLSGIGLQLDNTGHLSFDSSSFTLGLGGNFTTLSQFLGDSTSGFINYATSSVNTLEDNNTGILKQTEKNLNTQITKLNSSIADQISQVNAMQQRLYDHLAQSDALAYSITSQSDFLQQMFQQMTANLIGGA